MNLNQLADLAEQWCDDPTSGIDGVDLSREDWVGIRFAQEVRDFTTLWLTIGEITVAFEAYLSPPPPNNQDRVYELCLKRNDRTWLAHIAIDRHGDLVVRGQFPVADLTDQKIDDVIGATHELVEMTFRQIIQVGFRASDSG